MPWISNSTNERTHPKIRSKLAIRKDTAVKALCLGLDWPRTSRVDWLFSLYPSGRCMFWKHTQFGGRRQFQGQFREKDRGRKSVEDLYAQRQI